jgi:hypothetical protein
LTARALSGPVLTGRLASRRLVASRPGDGFGPRLRESDVVVVRPRHISGAQRADDSDLRRAGADKSA